MLGNGTFYGMGLQDYATGSISQHPSQWPT